METAQVNIVIPKKWKETLIKKAAQVSKKEKTKISYLVLIKNTLKEAHNLKPKE